MLIKRPSSRRHLTVNGGDPVALHVNVTALCSRTVTSELLTASSMLGGTATKEKMNEQSFIISINAIYRGNLPFIQFFNFKNSFDNFLIILKELPPRNAICK